MKHHVPTNERKLNYYELEETVRKIFSKRAQRMVIEEIYVIYTHVLVCWSACLKQFKNIVSKNELKKTKIRVHKKATLP